MAEENNSTKWLIVYCCEDESFSLIDECDAVCDKSILEIDDQVKFFYDGREYEGTVRDFGGPEDYDRLGARLKELNASNRRKEDSFHADLPRKTRGGPKYENALNSLKPRSKIIKVEKTSPKEVSLKEGHGSNTINSDDDEDDSSPSSSPIPENLPTCDRSAAAQLKRKGKESDINFLKKLKFSDDTSESSIRNEDEVFDAVTPPKDKSCRTSSDSDSGSINGTHNSNDKADIGLGDKKAEDINGVNKRQDEEMESSIISDKEAKKAEREAKKKAEAESKKKAEAESKKKAEAESKKKAEAEAKKKAEAEAKKKAEAEAKKKAEAESKKKAEAESKIKAEVEARKKAERKEKKKAKQAEEEKQKEEEEERQRLRKEKKKRKKAEKMRRKEEEDKYDREVESLSDEGMMKGGNSDYGDMNDHESKEQVEDSNNEDKNGHESNGKKHDSDEEKKDKKSTKKNKKLKSKVEPLKTDFQVLKWSQDDENVQEVAGRSAQLAKIKFYISHDDMQKAKAAKAASVFAKALLVGAFTDEALYKCSVFGGEYRAGGRENITRKPPLPSDIVAVILENAMHRQAGRQEMVASTEQERSLGWPAPEIS